MTLQNITDLLARAAEARGDRGVAVYSRGNLNEPRWLQYGKLREIACANSLRLRSIPGFKKGSVILLHFDNHWDHLIWLWSTLYVGCIPAFSTSLPNIPSHRDKHLVHLRNLLQDPICLTRSILWDNISPDHGLRMIDVEHLKSGADAPQEATDAASKTAVLMLTSGSTGQAKAVPLTHHQIFASITGKSAALPMDGSSPLLNWIRLDHVASLLEIHLHGLYLGVDQIHVEPEDIVANPPDFLRLIQKHRVSGTFAPNFLLVELQRCLESKQNSVDLILDLSCLRCIVSGGEANPIELCTRLSGLLFEKYGAPPNVLVPGFGMTETCAGSIYNTDCPNYDMSQGYESACLGVCVPGMQMRINDDSRKPVKPGEIGSIELRGPVIFSGYWNNASAAAEAFTEDGWFKTGDLGFLDKAGRLQLVGRTKEMININGVKYLLQDLDTAIEEAHISGVTPESVVCFVHPASIGATEEVCVVYVPEYVWDDATARHDAMAAINQRVLLATRTRPHVLPLPWHLLERTTLGKVSRTNLSIATEKGQYSAQEKENTRLIEEYQTRSFSPANSNTERTIVQELRSIFEIPGKAVGVNRPLFEMGLTSIQLIQLKSRLEARFHLPQEIPMMTMMAHPTIYSLAQILDTQGAKPKYTPVVTLQANGSETPLWLVHPGTGEALVFYELARFFTDRPVYALRAPGLEKEPHFATFEDCIRTYCNSIKEHQPHGPYALAGYSYGAVPAFAIAKTLEQEGDEVRFLASLNRLPYSYGRMRTVGWSGCLAHLAFFSELISEEQLNRFLPELLDLSKEEAVQRVVAVADPGRMAEMALSAEKLLNWVDVMVALQMILRQYAVSGTVKQMDVFYCHPLAIMECDKDEWLERLRKWDEYSHEEVRYHEVDGYHQNLLGPKYVRGFHRSLCKAMARRGV
ncbi:acetyl-CoA synthetase-like protein [Aspergillus avenaceus]|uniref:Acetyl-CoA synthetase-like protein n=1 Tax=Aspergillus avenaceus TaxID=36643 RepID=A0A5N6U6W7_ASPAV|nr:acetyl-CoA synthetase-like protein [Aspergillus avenaceus]